MRNINLVIYDNETNYASKVSTYFSDRARANNYSVFKINDYEQLLQVIENQEIDIVLTGASENNLDCFSVLPLVLVLDDGKLKQESPYRTIDKYQPLPWLEENIMAFFLEKEDQATYFIKQSGNSRIITSYSATSSVGKTTYLLNLSNELQKKNFRVLYLNLEMMHSTSLYLCDENKQKESSEVIYYVQKRSPKLLSLFQKYKRIDVSTGITYFNFINNPLEMLDFSSSDVEFLINAIKSTNEFDFIIIDIDSGLNERNQKVLSMSDKIVFLCENNSVSVFKTNLLIEEFKAIHNIDIKTTEKYMIVLNKVTGESTLLWQDNDVMFLPFIQEWLELSKPETIFDNTVYVKAVVKTALSEMEHVEHLNKNR